MLKISENVWTAGYVGVYNFEETGTGVSGEYENSTQNEYDAAGAVVNTSMLDVLGFDPFEAIGKTFKVSFVVVGALLQNAKEKIESYSTSYTIVGVFAGERTPLMYVPFIDLRSLGVQYYSQVRVIGSSEQQLVDFRRRIEALGYVTTSVADTVQQITALFASARALLFLLGMGTLGVAALGMFNTVTVSLFRTHA